MRAWPLLLTLVLVISTACGAGAKPVIKAYYNGQEATVSGVTLQVGEPFTVDLYVTPDRYTTVATRLREPGGGLESYERISGDAAGDIVRKKGGPNETVHFRWVLAPTDAWTGGTAPLDIQYDVWGETMDGDVQGYFTVVEAYISPEKYSPSPQSGNDLAPATIVALLLAARQRLSRITKPFYIKRLLVPSHVREIIQTIKNKKVHRSQGLDAQQPSHPVGRIQRDQLRPLTYFNLGKALEK